MNSILKLDPTIFHDTLPNGLQLFLKHNPKPASTVEFRLVVNVGSLVEEEHERGLAHFVEHMAFKGTASFDTGELIKAMEKIGVSYGQHMNAATGQDKTVYKLTVPIGHHQGGAAAPPAKAKEDEEAVEVRTAGSEHPSARARVALALQVLHEWSSAVRISDADVESERGVIEEERRSKVGAARRLTE